jgi:hypothetical protein
MTSKEKISIEVDLEDLIKMSKTQMDMITRLKRIVSDLNEELAYSFPDEIVEKVENIQEKMGS